MMCAEHVWQLVSEGKADNIAGAHADAVRVGLVKDGGNATDVKARDQKEGRIGTATEVTWDEEKVCFIQW